MTEDENKEKIGRLIGNIFASEHFTMELPTDPKEIEETVAACPRVELIPIKHIIPGTKATACGKCGTIIWASEKSQQCAQQWCLECVNAMIEEEKNNAVDRDETSHPG